MPRTKIYNKERKPFTIRIDKEKLEAAILRSKELNMKTFQQYLEKLIDEDLIIAEFERKKEILKIVKKK